MMAFAQAVHARTKGGWNFADEGAPTFDDLKEGRRLTMFAAFAIFALIGFVKASR
jgi:hypothetical protein